MPRRRRPYYPPGTTLVNGERRDPERDQDAAHPLSGNDPLYPIRPKGRRRDIRAELEEMVAGFDELALDDVKAFVQDLAFEVGSARTMHLDLLLKGAASKPHEWTLQVLFHGVRTVMQRHGVNATTSEYETAERQVKRSLYLRLAGEVSKIAGFKVPTDVKGLALRSNRIKRQSVSQAVVQKQERQARKTAKRYLWLWLHVMAFIAWIPRLLHLPRLFVFHAGVPSSRIRRAPSR